MNKSLGGSIFVYQAETFDYSYKEAIACLKEMCDQVAIVDSGSTDGTAEYVRSMADEKTRILCLPNEVWQSQKGKTKLSTFSNFAHTMLDTDCFFNLQADEIVHENSYDAIRRAIETDYPGFLCTRVNLWKDCHHQLNVSQERKPCSTEVIRLAKKGVLSFDDAENLCTPATDEFVNDIKIIHYGFVRKKEIMKEKIRHMLVNIFGMGPDPKLADMETFDWRAWFSEEDLIPFNDHPKIMQEWVKTRP